MQKQRFNIVSLYGHTLFRKTFLGTIIPEKQGSIRTKTGFNFIKLPPHSLTQTCLKDNKWDELKDFAHVAEKIFPPAKLTSREKAVQFLQNSCSPLQGYPIDIAPNPDFKLSYRLKPEVFTSASMYDLLKDIPEISPKILSILLDLVCSYKEDYDLFSFFSDGSFKPDLDTTSVCIWALLHGNRLDKKEARKTAKILTMNRSPEDSIGNGALEIFIPQYKASVKKGGRQSVLDPGVMSNVMRLLYHLDMGWEATATEDYLFKWIQTRSYSQLTTKHYEPDYFLCQLSYSLEESEEMKERFGLPIMQRWLESIGKTKNPISLAQRIITANNLGLLDRNYKENRQGYLGLLGKNTFEEFKIEIKMLRNFQDEVSGGWPLDTFHHCSRFFYGSAAVVTAYATKALGFVENID